MRVEEDSGDSDGPVGQTISLPGLRAANIPLDTRYPTVVNALILPGLEEELRVNGIPLVRPLAAHRSAMTTLVVTEARGCSALTPPRIVREKNRLIVPGSYSVTLVLGTDRKVDNFELQVCPTYVMDAEGAIGQYILAEPVASRGKVLREIEDTTMPILKISPENGISFENENENFFGLTVDEGEPCVHLSEDLDEGEGPIFDWKWHGDDGSYRARVEEGWLQFEYIGYDSHLDPKEGERAHYTAIFGFEAPSAHFKYTRAKIRRWLREGKLNEDTVHSTFRPYVRFVERSYP